VKEKLEENGHNVFSCADAKQGKSKADAIKSRNRATEKNMKGTVVKELVGHQL
jgi:hypothetical protein